MPKIIMIDEGPAAVLAILKPRQRDLWPVVDLGVLLPLTWATTTLEQ